MTRFLSIIILLTCMRASAVDVRFEWDKIEEPNLSFYRMQWGPAPGVYTNSVAVTNATTYSLSLPAGSTNYAILTAIYWVGEAGAESEPTPELVFVVPKPAPKNFKVTTTLQVAESPDGPWRDLWALTQNLESPERGLFYRSQVHAISEE